jgi:protein-L-isoaspartate(D-aspartate) O-methyltransferase
MKKLILLALIAVAGEAAAEDAKCVRERAAMIETIRAYARSDAGLFGPQGISESVLAAMGQTERPRFIPGASCSVAYADRPVSIGQEQTISQPLIVAVMTHLAQVKFDHTVLEVGTGSGYQAAILSQLTQKVCTVEIIPPLAEAAAEVLRDLGYDNVSVKVGDGYHGWVECGPFDAVVVTAALEHVPPPLIEQLKVGGRLIMPLGLVHSLQQLTIVEKIAASETKTRSVLLVRFVPFTRSSDQGDVRGKKER